MYGIHHVVTHDWGVELFEDRDGCPVREFLDGLETVRRAKILAIIQLLAEQGPTLPFPYSSQVAGKLRELRTHYGSEVYRVLYFGSTGRVFVLVHAFVKRSAKIPPAEIATAERRMKTYLERGSSRRRGTKT